MVNIYRELREALDLTQEQMARLLEVHPMTVSKWERGVQLPEFEEMRVYLFLRGYTKLKGVVK